MSLETETLSLIIWGFYMVGGFSLFTIIYLWISSRNKNFIWFIAQLVLLCLSFLKFTYAIRMKPEIPPTMLSEENSLALGISGILWAISMFCMLKGVWNLSCKKE